MIDFNKMPYIYMNDIEKCNLLQRYILVHSILYYEMNESVISDKEYDSTAKQLYCFMKNLEDNHITQYGYVFWDFTPYTGFDLYSRLNELDKNYLCKIAKNVLKLYKKGKQK